jgi:hypothetical protein
MGWRVLTSVIVCALMAVSTDFTAQWWHPFLLGVNVFILIDGVVDWITGEK